MKEQLQFEKLVADISNDIRDAWDTAVDYNAHLLTRPSNPELFAERLRQQIQSLYVQVAFTLEALQLPEALAAFRKGFSRFRDDSLQLDVDQHGNAYPLALEYLATYVSTLVSATSDAGGRFDKLPLLERILWGTPRLIRD
jgi:hypothetical protein